MSDKMINSTSKIPAGHDKGIGETVNVHMDEWSMNEMCDPIEAYKPAKGHSYHPGTDK